MASMCATAFSLSAQTQIGYTTGEMGRSTVFHYGNSQRQGMAIRLSADKLQALAGHSIGSIYTAFGSSNAILDKKAHLFIATSFDADPVIEQTYTIGAANRWQTIALDTPYTITGQEAELIVGYTLQANSDNIPEALQADHINDLRGCSFAWDGHQWVDLYGTGFGSANIRLILNDVVSFSDAIVGELDMTERYYQAGKEYNHRSHIYNFGTTPITSLDVTIHTGDESSTVTYDGLNIAQFDTFQFDLPVLSASESGSTDIDVSVSINGAQESDLTDNLFQTSAFFYPADMERAFLVEEFTGMTCGNCPGGQRTLHAALEQTDLSCVSIMHHAGYAADFYSSDADFDYTMYYGSASTFAPAVMINRTVNPAVGTVPVFNVGTQPILSTLDYANLHQPYVSLGLKSTFDEETRQVDVTLDILAHNDFPSATLLNAFLIQDGIVGYQANGGNDYVHNGLLRQVLTGNSWGLLLPEEFGKDQREQWTHSFVLPDAIQSDFWTPDLLTQAGYTADLVTFATDPAQMRIVAYIASYDPNDIKRNPIYNCIEVPLVNGEYIQRGLDTPEAIQQVKAQADATMGTFSLDGRRLTEASRPGLYIINGRKALIR